MSASTVRVASSDDIALVAAQLGREPREPWRIVVRCPNGHPRVIASPSRLSDGTRFPTTFWLTCPMLIAAIGEAESAGGAALWAGRLARDRRLARRMALADAAYRHARAEESGGRDVCAGTGVAGMRDSALVKCLHAHVSAFLAGIGDPVGEAVAADLPDGCEDERCARLSAERSDA